MDREQDDFRQPLVRHFSDLSEYNYKAHTRRRWCAYEDCIAARPI